MKALVPSLALLLFLAGCTGPGAVGVNQVKALHQNGARSKGATNHAASSSKKETAARKKKSAEKVDENFSPRGGFR